MIFGKQLHIVLCIALCGVFQVAECTKRRTAYPELMDYFQENKLDGNWSSIRDNCKAFYTSVSEGLIAKDIDIEMVFSDVVDALNSIDNQLYENDSAVVDVLRGLIFKRLIEQIYASFIGECGSEHFLFNLKKMYQYAFSMGLDRLAEVFTSAYGWCSAERRALNDQFDPDNAGYKPVPMPEGGYSYDASFITGILAQDDQQRGDENIDLAVGVLAGLAKPGNRSEKSSNKRLGGRLGKN